MISDNLEREYIVHVPSSYDASKPNTKPEQVVSKINDVKFFSKIIEDLKNKFNIDEKRIYATGISNGGQMSHD